MAQVFDDGSTLGGTGELVPTYEDAEREGVLFLGRNASELVRVSNTATVSIDLKNDFDKQRHKHQNFGRKKFLGISFASIEVEFVIMPDEETDFFERVVPLLREKGKQGSGLALQVVNYQMNRVGVTTCNVLRARIGSPSARSGRHVRLELEEWSTGPTEPKKSPAAAEQYDPAPAGLVDKRLSIKKNT